MAFEALENVFVPLQGIVVIYSFYGKAYVIVSNDGFRPLTGNSSYLL